MNDASATRPDAGNAPKLGATSLPCVQSDGRGFGALHLPIAPRCNVQCVYCDRSRACANNSPGGSPSVLLTPQQALVFAREAIAQEPKISCAGVSGPGDALANAEATLSTLRLLREEQPNLPFFIATNGLDLVEHVDALLELGVELCTVTVNAFTPSILARLVDWASSKQGIIAGEEAAQYLIDRQLAGISAASQRGIVVRINTQLIAGINDGEIEAIARRCAKHGAKYIRVRPHTPSPDLKGSIAGSRVPTVAMLEHAEDIASKHLEVIQHCRLCSPDSLGCFVGPKNGAIRSALIKSSLCQDVAFSEPKPQSAPISTDLGVRSVALRQLQLIARVARLLATSEDDPLTTLRRVLLWLDEELGLRRGVLTLMDVAGETLSAQVTHGVAQEQEDRMRYRPDEGITGQVFATGASVMLPSLQAAPNYLDRSGLRTDLDLSKLAFFCVPICDRGIVIGTLSVDKQNSLLKDADSDLRFLEEIGQLLAPFVQRRRLEESLAMFHRLRSSDGANARLVGRSSIMEEVRRLIAKVAGASTTVLLTGETGTGKSAAAALLHELSNCAKGPFIEVNCGAIPEHLIESELFGHEKGAFTGAIQKRLGVFERARGGTVFLDEIGELGQSAQTRLLRVLQTRRFERVGGSETLTTDARLIAATNRDLGSAVANGEFRADLFYRLNVFPISMPPLRERGNADIMLLADSFVERHGKAMGKAIFRLDTPAIDMLTSYHWPGNVRELENVIERAVVLADGDVIHGHHLPPSLQMNRYAAVPEALDFASRVAAFETELITEALKDASGNQTKAAERLGLTKRIIQYKIRTYGIAWERFLPKRQ